MNKLALLLVAFSSTLGLCAEEMRAFGHVYFGPARYSTLAAGAGGDALLYRGAALAFDAGYLWGRSSPSSGVGLASLNGAYHFARNFERPDRDQPIVPFATAGYGLGFRSGTINLFNWGGGAVWWFKEDLGLRVEVRDYRYESRSFSTQFRIGLAFR